jgi:hypothetical protein
MLFYVFKIKRRRRGPRTCLGGGGVAGDEAEDGLREAVAQGGGGPRLQVKNYPYRRDGELPFLQERRLGMRAEGDEVGDRRCCGGGEVGLLAGGDGAGVDGD